MFAYKRGFRGRAIEWWRQTNSTATNPRCHGDEIWDKIGYNSAYRRDIPRCLRITGGFRGQANEWRKTNSTATNPRCHGNEIWDKIGYNSVCIRDIYGVLGVGLLNNVTQILPRPTLVALATTFETKWAITQLLWEISLRYLRLVGGFRDRAIEWRQTNSATADPGCHSNEIWE